MNAILIKVRYSLSLCILVLVVGCSGGSSSPVVNVSSTPAPVPVPPPIAAAPEPVPTLTITGVAAIGAAIAGALVEVIDGAGNLLDVGETATGANGSYQVALPENVILPVIIRVTPEGGAPLLNVVTESDGASLVANINPITNLVSKTVLGNVDASDAASLAGALATVDTSTIAAQGDAIVTKVLGSGVDYSKFSSDPTFVANDGASAGSAADAMLDTLAKQAVDSGNSLDDQLTNLAAQDSPPKLLEDPVFQVQLIGEMIKGGTPAEELESSLSSVGALAAPVDGEADVFRAVISAVPAVIATTKADASALDGNSTLQNIAIDAAIKVVSDTVAQKKARFAASPQDIVNLVSSDSLKNTATRVVAASVTPILVSIADDPNSGSVMSGLNTVVNKIATTAATVASGLDFTDSSQDASSLVIGFVSSKVSSVGLTVQDLTSIQDGTTSAETIVAAVGDVSKAQQDLQTFAQENPALSVTPIENLIQQIPVGNWNNSSWGSFNWG